MAFTVSPCPGRDFISFQTRKETKQRNAFQTANTSVSSLLIFGFWHERSATLTHQRAVEHPPQAPTPRTRFASTAVYRGRISVAIQAPVPPRPVGNSHRPPARFKKPTNQTTNSTGISPALLSASPPPACLGCRAGCWLLVAGCWLLVTGCRLPQRIWTVEAKRVRGVRAGGRCSTPG